MAVQAGGVGFVRELERCVIICIEQAPKTALAFWERFLLVPYFGEAREAAIIELRERFALQVNPKDAVTGFTIF